MKAAILAAGRGERLSPLTDHKPKPLLKILNTPIIQYTIGVLKHVGIQRCIVITGYKAQSIKSFLGDGSRFGVEIQYSYNPEYPKGNAVSLRTAEPLLEGEDLFLLIMADHLVHRSIVEAALRDINRAPLLCVDREPRYPPQIKDATKVLVNPENFIVDIGKALPSWNAVDTGVFLLNEKIFQAIDYEAERENYPLELSGCIKRMISAGTPLWACDVSGSLWLDIDTRADLEFAEKLFKGVLDA
ncbi:nucleotidyltransferase family protein [Candidatus Bathyarchaeota archaeon]|nr:nucleotidyltransferase family protein [Candidatus Bathyarchaeota archaeon]